MTDDRLMDSLDPYGDGPTHWDIDGNPISLRTWAEYLERGDRRIGDTTIGKVIWVSTVWVGIDMGFGRDEPLIFETMIFGGPQDQFIWRWATRLEAEAGHTVIVTTVNENRHGWIRYERGEQRRRMKERLRGL